MRTASDRLRVLARLLAAVAFLGLFACSNHDADISKPALLPGLAKKQAIVDTLQLRGAGNRILVTLHQVDGSWHVLQRDDWAADAGRISQYLFVLSQARRMEAKTSDPKLYQRLGVEPTRAADAKSLELTLSGKGLASRLVIGNEHPRLEGYYVRVDAAPGTWLTDLPVYFDPDPKVWLDRRLVDIPLARITKVEIADATGKPFSLSHRDDRFRLDDAPSAAMHESFQGDAIAQALDQLQFEDVAADTGQDRPLRTLGFATVEGMRVELQALRDGERLWVRLKAAIDPEVADSWAALSAGNAASVAALGPRVAALNKACAGRRFELADPVASTLMLDHDQILSGPTPR